MIVHYTCTVRRPRINPGNPGRSNDRQMRPSQDSHVQRYAAAVSSRNEFNFPSTSVIRQSRDHILPARRAEDYPEINIPGPSAPRQPQDNTFPIELPRSRPVDSGPASNCMNSIVYSWPHYMIRNLCPEILLPLGSYSQLCFPMQGAPRDIFRPGQWWKPFMDLPRCPIPHPYAYVYSTAPFYSPSRCIPGPAHSRPPESDISTLSF
jgi:hypothetical protein